MKSSIVVLFAVLAFAAPALGACAHPKVSLAKMEGEVMCPVCHTTLDQSNSTEAHHIEAFIAARIARCESESQIKRELIANWGTVILAAPPRRGFDLLAWWLPLGGIIAGALILGLGAWHWRNVREPEVVAEPLDAETERKIDDLLAHFD